MKFRFKLGEQDAARYPEGEAWFTFDPAEIEKKTARELMKLEVYLDGHKLAALVADLEKGGALGLMGAMYVARRMAGVNEKWENFDPYLFAAEIEFDAEKDNQDNDDGGQVAADADPTGPVTEASPST